MFKKPKFIEKTQDFFKVQRYKARKRFFDFLMDKKKLDGTNKLTLGWFLSHSGAHLFPQGKTEKITIEREFLTEILLCSDLSNIVYEEPKIRTLPEFLDHIEYEQTEEKSGIVPFFVAESSIRNTIYVVCRGTFCFDDIITDLKARATDFGDSFIHEGIYLSGKYVFDNSLPYIGKLLAQNSDRKIIFTGHSLGAGSACIASILYKGQFPNSLSESIVFAPPPTITMNLWEESKIFVTSICLGDDPVPFSSLYNAAMASIDVLPKKISTYFLQQLDEEKLVPPGIQYHIYLLGVEPLVTTIEKIPHASHFLHLPKGLNEAHHSMPLYTRSIRYILNNLN